MVYHNFNEHLNSLKPKQKNVKNDKLMLIREFSALSTDKNYDDYTLMYMFHSIVDWSQSSGPFALKVKRRSAGQWLQNGDDDF
jgi:hypothetical protein